MVGERRQAVCIFIANLRQLGSGEMLGKPGTHGSVQGQIGAVNHIREGDLLLRGNHLDYGGIFTGQHG